MQNYDKTQNSILDLLASDSSSIAKAKGFVWKVLPIFLKTSLLIFTLLFFQAFWVGAFDRLGISPKWSLLGSSFFFAAVFGGLAIWGGLKEKTYETESVNETLIKEPVCKILTVRHKTFEE